MELEEHDGFNNNQTHNYHPKPYNSSSTKKYHGDRSPIFNLNVPLSEKNLTQFLNSFEKTKSPDVQLNFVNALLKASPYLFEKFAETKGSTLLARILRDSHRDFLSKTELVDRIVTFFHKIELTNDILTRTRIHHEIENIKNNPQVTEELANKTFKLLIKWKPIIEQWQAEGGERSAEEYQQEYQREYQRERASRAFIKRTKGHDRFSNDSRSDERSSEERSYDHNRKFRDPKKLLKTSRRGEPYSRERGGGGKYLARRTGGGGSRIREESPKKYVQWSDEDTLVQFKFFRISDEPSHRPLTEDEVTQVQERMKDDNKAVMFGSLSSEDLKHKESQMEGNSFKIKKDTEKELQSKLNAMVESISWYRPRRLVVNDSTQPEINSFEAREHDERITKKLPCFYMKEHQIPDQPSFDFVKNTNKGTRHPPATIPLVNSSADQDPEENQDVLNALEKFVRNENPEGAIGTTSDMRIVEETKEPVTAQEKDKIKVAKPTQPLRGILKKSKEQIQKEKEEARALEEEKQKQREKERHGISLDSELVMKLMSGDMTQEEQEKLVDELKERGDAEFLLQNIKTLKSFMSNVSQTTNKPKKKEKYSGNPGSHFGQEPRKMVKYNPESLPKMQGPQQGMPMMQSASPMSNLSGPPNPMNPSSMQIEQEVSPYGGGGGGYNRNKDFGPGEERDYRGGNFDPMKKGMKKTAFRPSNYKTVPCVWFHSAKGCPYGDTCNFIHDVNHAGRQTPNMHKYVRPIDQLSKTGREDEEGGNLSMPPTNASYPSMMPTQNPQVGMNQPPNTYMGGGGGGGMKPEQMQNPYSAPPQNYGRVNQPSSTHMNPNYMGQNPNPMKQQQQQQHMPYNNRMDNRMGGGMPGGNQMGGYNPHGQQNQRTHYPQQHGGHPGGHHNRGPSHGGHHMMMPQNQGYQNPMMYPPTNQRPPTNQYPPHSMPMMMGYNPNQGRPGMMPPQGYGMGGDPNKHKD